MEENAIIITIIMCPGAPVYGSFLLSTHSEILGQWQPLASQCLGPGFYVGSIIPKGSIRQNIKSLSLTFLIYKMGQITFEPKVITTPHETPHETKVITTPKVMTPHESTNV